MTLNARSDQAVETAIQTTTFSPSGDIQTATVVINHLDRVFHGFSTPGFSAKMKKNMLVQYTPYSDCEQKHTFVGAVRDVAFTAGGSQTTTNWKGLEEGFYVNGTSLLTPAIRQEGQFLVQEAANKILSEFDALTFLAEYKQIVSLFNNLVRKIAMWLKNPPHLPTYFTKQFLNDWLEGRYGWRLFIRDLEEISKLLNNMNEKHGSRVKGTASNGYTWTENSSSLVPNGNLNLECTVDTQYVLNLRAYAIADMLFSGPRFNLIVTLWETKKFSFVLDWIVSLGRSLSLLSFHFVTSNSSMCWGYMADISRRVTYSLLSWSPTVLTASCSHEALYTSHCEERFPVVLTYKPQIKSRLTIIKLIDLWALFWQLTRRAK